jgi:hypothetical protein
MQGDESSCLCVILTGGGVPASRLSTSCSRLTMSGRLAADVGLRVAMVHQFRVMGIPFLLKGLFLGRC